MTRNKQLTFMAALMAVTLMVAGCGNEAATTPSKEEPSKPAVTEEKKEPAKDPDKEKEAKYQAAVKSFAEGSSYSAYYDFTELGDYKDSARLAHDALVQNKLNFFGGEPADWFRLHIKELTPVPMNQLAGEMGGKIWLVPNVHAVGYLEYHYREDGSGEIFEPFLGETWREFTWSVNDKRFELDYLDTEESPTAVKIDFQEEYYKIADGVMICFVPELENQPPGHMPTLYIDKNSDFGKRYLKASATIEKLNREKPDKWRLRTDPKGLYYAEVEG